MRKNEQIDDLQEILYGIEIVEYHWDVIEQPQCSRRPE